MTFDALPPLQQAGPERKPGYRIAFVIMSAVHEAAAVNELAQALAPHLVLIHHDFAQTPDFPIGAANAVFVPDARRTGWNCWGFSEGIFHSLRFALENHDFDYLQLLSPTCLPIKPVSEFEAYVANSPHEAHFECVDVAAELDALMSVGYRAYTPRDTLRHRIVRRLVAQAYYGRGAHISLRSVAGIELASRRTPERETQFQRLGARAAVAMMQALRSLRLGWHLFDEHLRAQFGSIWFGARREVVVRIVERFADQDVQRTFRRLDIADEFLVPTLLHYSSTRAGPNNHLVNDFVNANPSWFEPQDFARLSTSPAFFARKFHDDVSDPIRRRVLDELVWRKSQKQSTFGSAEDVQHRITTTPGKVTRQ